MTTKKYDISWTHEVLDDRYQRIIRHPDYQALCDEHSSYTFFLPGGSTTTINFFDNTGFENKMLLLDHPHVEKKFLATKEQFDLDSIVHYESKISPEELLSHPIFKNPTAVHTTYKKEERDGIIELSPVRDDGTMHILVYAPPETPNKQILDEIAEQVRSAQSPDEFSSITPAKNDITTYTVDYETGFCNIHLDIRPPLTVKGILTTVNDIINEAKSHLAVNRNRLKENKLAYQAYDLRLNYTSLPVIASMLGHKMTDRQFALTKLQRGYTLIHGQSFDKKHMKRLMVEHVEKTGQWQKISDLTPSLKEKLHTKSKHQDNAPTDQSLYESYTLKEREHRLEILYEVIAFCDDCSDLSCATKMRDGFTGASGFRKDLICSDLKHYISNLSQKLSYQEPDSY